MKKQLLGNFFTAIVLLAVSAYFVNLQAQVSVAFSNETGARQSGIAGTDGGALTLDFTIDGSGIIALDASTPETADSGDSLLVNSWDNPNAGTTNKPSLFGLPFTLTIKTNDKRLDNRNDYGGGFGIGGKNSGRIDDGGKEILYFILGGNVGLVIDSIGYNNVGGGADGNFRVSDFDTDSIYYITQPSVATEDTALILGSNRVMSMRYAGDSLSVTTSDTIGDGSGGGTITAIYFTVVAPLPGVVETTPADGDTLVDVSADYVIKFNTSMNKTATEAVVAFTPDVPNRANTWNAAATELTVSFDDLPNYTKYEVSVGANMESEDGSNSDADFAFSFQTLPAAPTVLATYPVDEAKEVPANTPIILEFSRAMIADSVNKAISFDPALNDLAFSWNGAVTKVVISTAEMTTFTDYTMTVGTLASDIYGVVLTEPVIITFKTAAAVSVDNQQFKNVVLYPNPVSDVLHISGMEVSKVSIYRLTGQLMKSTQNSKEIDMSDIEPGSYLFNVSDGNGNSVRKLVVVQ